MSNHIEYNKSTWSVFCRASQSYIVDEQEVDSIEKAFECAESWLKENGFGRKTLIVESTHYIDNGDKRDWIADDLYQKDTDKNSVWVKSED